MPETTRRWCFAGQLGPHFLDDTDQPVLLVESRAVFERRRFHRRKAHLVLSALRHRAAELGDQAVFLQTHTYREALDQVGDRLSVCQPTSWAADQFVRSIPTIDVVPARGFCTDRTTFDEWAQGHRTLKLENFYRDARQRFDLLMDGDQPAEGRWNFDADNREPAPADADALGVPPPWRPEEDEIDEKVRADLDRWERDGVEFVGRDGPREFAVTAAEAQAALTVFLRDRLPYFGPHEDAMLSGDRFMAHSLLSAPMNLGLLDPLDCAYAAEDAYRSGRAPLGSVEGYIRQLIGWRTTSGMSTGISARNTAAAMRSTRAPGCPVVHRSGRRRRRRALPERCARAGPRSRLGAPHSAADGVVQLRATTRLESRRGHRLVPPMLRRRLRLGDGRQRRRHVPARRWRADGDQAVRRRRRVNQSDERLLRPVPVSARRAGGPERLPVHRRLLVVPRPQREIPCRQPADEPTAGRAATVTGSG